MLVRNTHYQMIPDIAALPIISFQCPGKQGTVFPLMLGSETEILCGFNLGVLQLFQMDYNNIQEKQRARGDLNGIYKGTAQSRLCS